MNDMIKARFMEICPAEKVADMTPDDVDVAVNVAFKIIGYSPKNLKGAIDRANAVSESEWLYQFIYDVWRLDS